MASLSPVFQLLFGALRPWATGAWSIVSRLLGLVASPPKPSLAQTDSLRSRSHSASPELLDTTTTQPSPPVRRPYPSVIYWFPVPGEWQRKLCPHWPESAFAFPDIIPWGHIYYVTKGDFIRRGATAVVERLPSGDIIKTPNIDPYSPRAEEEARQAMEHEYNVYAILGPNPSIPKLIEWDSTAKTLILEHLPLGDLESYLQEHDDVDTSTRRKWALQASRALQSLHAAEIVHNDVTPRNFLLDKDANLRICDFAGSSYPGHAVSTVAPGSRYQSHPWPRAYVPTMADDVFSLGSVLYFIATGQEPYSDLEEEEIEVLFEKLDFPTCTDASCDSIIQDCWRGRLSTAESVVEALLRSFGSEA